MPLSDILFCGSEAERAGFEFISLAESFYRDASVLSSAIACNTEKIKIGSSVYPIATRTPFQIAMATATLNELSNGIGYKVRIERYFGLKMANSNFKMREYIDIIKGLLSGKEFSYTGKFFDFQDFPRLVDKRMDVPILFGSSGDKMLKLAGQTADGVILNSLTNKEYIRHAISIISKSTKELDRDNEYFEIASSVIFSVADKREDAIGASRHDVLFYALYPELNPIIEKTPYVERVAEIRKASAKGDFNGSLSLITDDMIEDLTISGTPRECRSKVRNLYNYGVTLPIIRVAVKPFREAERKEVFIKAI